MIRETQEAAAAALLASPGVTAIVRDTPSGPAVFAPRQTFDDLFPRVTLDTPQRVPLQTGCGVLAEMIVTVHSWAQGPDCTLVAGELADAVTDALDQALAIAGHRVAAWSVLGSQPVGDPRADVEHVVSNLRYSVQPAG